MPELRQELRGWLADTVMIKCACGWSGEGVQALDHVATVADPAQHHLTTRSKLDELTPREHETLVLMAQGLSNVAIAERMVVTERAIERYVGEVLWKMTGFLNESPPTYNRRVLAVLHYLHEVGS